MMAHDKSVPVHRVTQYFRGRLANKGADEEGKGREVREGRPADWLSPACA